MPTYSYVCDACGHAYDRSQRMSDSPDKRCPKCGLEKARRLIGGGTGLIFKGSGFYTTDYARQSSGDVSNGESGKKSSEEKTSTDTANDSGSKKSSTDSSD